MSMELYIPPKKVKYNPTNGQFLKGHEPFNKGKKWSEWMPKRKQRKVLRIGMKNLKVNMNIGGWNARQVICLNDDGKFVVFPSAKEAGRVMGICPRNIISCCRKKRKHAGNMMWFYEDDDEWLSLVEN